MLVMAGNGFTSENPAGITVADINGVPSVLIRNPGVFGRSGQKLAGEVVSQIASQHPELVHPNARVL